MFFTTTSLFIAGLVAAAAPIAIHLLTKGKPRKVVFAGLRFTQGTLAVNRRRLRLKRLLLLSLRVVLFVLLGLALARPMFAPKNVASSEDAAEIADGKAPVAAAIVLDTSLRMGRVKDNTTLLERAKATARTILDQLPKGSEIAVLDGETSGDGFQSDRFAAKTRLEETTVEPGGRAVAESTFKALALLRSSKLTRREIYALTDRTTAGWSDRDVQRLRRAVAADEQRPVAFYLVDLGDDAVQNVAVVDAALRTLADDPETALDPVVKLQLLAVVVDSAKLYPGFDELTKWLEETRRSSDFDFAINAYQPGRELLEARESAKKALRDAPDLKNALAAAKAAFDEGERSFACEYRWVGYLDEVNSAATLALGAGKTVEEGASLWVARGADATAEEIGTMTADGASFNTAKDWATYRWTPVYARVETAKQ